jgi:hypothetical protein
MDGDHLVLLRTCRERCRVVHSKLVVIGSIRGSRRMTLDRKESFGGYKEQILLLFTITTQVWDGLARTHIPVHDMRRKEGTKSVPSNITSIYICNTGKNTWRCS